MEKVILMRRPVFVAPVHVRQNQAVQPQKMVRGLKYRKLNLARFILSRQGETKVLISLCSRAADLHLSHMNSDTRKTVIRACYQVQHKPGCIDTEDG